MSLSKRDCSRIFVQVPEQYSTPLDFGHDVKVNYRVMAGGIDVPERPQNGTGFIDAVAACGREDPVDRAPAQFDNLGGIEAKLGPGHG